MFNRNTRILVCDLLIAVGEEEKNLEVLRQILCEQPKFEPYAAFKRIDRKKSSYINSANLSEFLLQNGVDVNEKLIGSYIRFHDTDRDLRLSYPEFLRTLLPQSNPSLRTIVSQRPTYEVRSDEKLEYEVEYSLARLLQEELTYFEKLEPLKHRLQDFNDEYSIKEAFYHIDENQKNFIDFYDLQNFFQKNKSSVIEEQIIAILRRIDRDDDGVLKYDEFKEALSPIDSVVPAPKNHTKVIYSTTKPMTESRIAQPYKSYLRESVKKSSHDDEDPLEYNDIKHFSFKNGSYAKPEGNNDDLNYQKQSFHEQPSYRETEFMEQTIKKSVGPNKMALSSIVKEDMTRITHNHSVGEKSRHIRPKTSTKPTQENCRTVAVKKRTKSVDPNVVKELGELSRTFKQMIFLDKEVELLKQELALRGDFNLIDAFRFFDIDGKGSSSSSDLERSLNDLGLFPAKHELFLLIRRFNRDSDGRIKYADFVEMIVPHKKEFSQLINSRKSNNFSNESDLVMTRETLRVFKNILQNHLENEAAAEALRQRLNTRKNFKLDKIFKFLDTDDDGYLSISDLRRFMSDHALDLGEGDMSYLLKRFDKNNDKKVSYSEFLQEMTPKSPKKYI